MKRSLSCLLLAGFFVAIGVGIVYENSTCVARGWLCDEAFFEGRPTSYWRVRVDHWLSQFVEPDDAVRAMVLVNGADAVDGVVISRPARHPIWGPLRDLFVSEESRLREWDTPAVLLSSHPDATAVLVELAREEKYRMVVERALQ